MKRCDGSTYVAVLSKLGVGLLELLEFLKGLATLVAIHRVHSKER